MSDIMCYTLKYTPLKEETTMVPDKFSFENCFSFVCVLFDSELFPRNSTPTVLCCHVDDDQVHFVWFGCICLCIFFQSEANQSIHCALSTEWWRFPGRCHVFSQSSAGLASAEANHRLGYRYCFSLDKSIDFSC